MAESERSHPRRPYRGVAAFAVGGLTALADQRTEAAVKLLGQLK